MREISLHIMDIIENSITANASLIELDINENIIDNLLIIKITDNGNGIDSETLKKIKDPFVTSRTTRKVGLGISLFEATCLRCNGYLEISSELSKGTEVRAVMEYNNIDRPPLGKIEETIISVLLNPNVDLIYNHYFNEKHFNFDSRQIKSILGTKDISAPEILMWIKDYIKENLNEISGGAF